ncbi:AraC family transcriptional regulator [Burkholderia cenocepacia]|uniref:AraC family transcriptional regulator n=1 Tax=Burkholderia cenocepacia TaxID=95486 RepID=UPI002855E0D1|nr:AraC family transcriptional regulator [Burkholderia cenocepacia]MDR8071912.1 AraC family transcriptional regulator [Burkholderia cenocepacia]
MNVYADHTIASWPENSLVTRTTDLDEARSAIGNVYCPYRFDAKRTDRRECTEMHQTKGAAVALSKFSYGTEIDIRPDSFSDFFLVLTTIQGSAEICNSHFSEKGDAGMTIVASADEAWKFKYSADNEQFVARISLDRTTEIAASLTGTTRRIVPRLQPSMSDPGARHRWLLQAAHLRELTAMQPTSAARKMLLARAEETLILTLLLQQSATVVEAVFSGSTEVAPAFLRRAVDYVHENLDQPLTLEDIASAARCSIRSLHRMFKEHKNASVMQYVKNLRLQRVREELLDSTTARSVTDVALRWGFSQLGQFAADYRTKFGEKPSDTLRRR